ncbi:zinc ribbon protein [Thermosporothrix hazakensis]|uniref:Zinc ribbon protein n=2 Tax=Thermosporothrix TaxID=768650 RepID=A0A326TVL5_THEHA|nr:zinc ribbon domain-containing protein [Thermosporothrix hazakensis]PZW20796.1 zinc ribbon protein [Thermosporothrix hazakensis]BBH89367.1 hypothetical protein KTC_41180 [Thermosporothrix sp. COM3]GCE47549.1 hypothetical protein KTH_24180 [Thermosporothrix hazakensis]
MRCPFCGNVNQDTATVCPRCGRLLIQPHSPRPQMPVPPMPQSFAPPPPRQQAVPPEAPSVAARSAKRRLGTQRVEAPAPVRLPVQTPPVAPDPPAPFPPKTVGQLQALAQGALEYRVVDDTVAYGRKKVVRIAYAHCAQWQQVATLYKALRAYRSDAYDILVIQGVHPQEDRAYTYTNGQIEYNRNVRLGSDLISRYEIETGTGFESDALRIVLTEK